MRNPAAAEAGVTPGIGDLRPHVGAAIEGLWFDYSASRRTQPSCEASEPGPLSR